MHPWRVPSSWQPPRSSLEQFKFTGTGDYPLTGTQANAIPATLDLYNNRILCI